MTVFLFHNFKCNIQNQHSLNKMAIFLIERVIFTQKDEMAFRKWNVSGLRAFLAAKAGPSFSTLPTKQTSFFIEITLYSIFNENQRLQWTTMTWQNSTHKRRAPFKNCSVKDLVVQIWSRRLTIDAKSFFSVNWKF